MDKMVANGTSAGLYPEIKLKNPFALSNSRRLSTNRSSRAFRPSQQPIDEKKCFKELGMFTLRKTIEDSVLRAEMLTSTALKHEVANQNGHEEVVREYNLWDDLGESNELLMKLADSAKAVDTLQDVRYKAEEAGLINELAEVDSINYGLIKQAYSSSLDVNKFLDNYEMSKLLNEPYDMEGACVTVESRCGDVNSERWAGQLVQMYMKWAERQGHTGRIVEKSHSSNGHLISTTIELEFKYAYGYLSGETGLHSMIRVHENESLYPKASLAFVDVIPLFLESSPDLSIAEEDILVTYASYNKPNTRKTSPGVQIQHTPTGLAVHSTGERSRFANKIKALNRLKSKLLVIMEEQQVFGIKNIRKEDIEYSWRSEETRTYTLWPRKMVQDLRSGMEFADVTSVLDGYLDPLISAQINSRQTETDM